MTAKKPMAPLPKLLLTVKDVGQILGVRTSKVYELINHNLLPALKLDSTKVRLADLEKFLANNVGKDLRNLDNIIPFRNEGEVNG